MGLAVQLFGVAIVSTIMLVMIRQIKPDFAPLVVLAIAGIVLVMIHSVVREVVFFLTDLAGIAGVGANILNSFLQIVGVTYLIAYGAQFCRDAGEGAIAEILEMGGKMVMVAMAIPVLRSILDTILKLVG